MIERMVGGLIPLVRFRRDQWAVETTWTVEITWLRTRVEVAVTR